MAPAATETVSSLSNSNPLPPIFYNNLAGGTGSQLGRPETQGSCPAPDTGDDSMFADPVKQKNRMNDILDKMNASETCKTTARTQFDQTLSTVEDRGGNKNSLGGGCSFFACYGGFSSETDFGTFSSDMDTSMSSFANSSGCGSLFTQLNEISNSTQVLNCEITKMTEEVSQSVSNSATVTIRTESVQLAKTREYTQLINDMTRRDTNLNTVIVQEMFKPGSRVTQERVEIVQSMMN